MKKITQNTIQTLNNIVSISENKSEVVEKFSKEYQLTNEFVSYFKEYLTKEAFSSSSNLTASLINNYPELFDIDVWKESPSSQKDISVLFDARLSSELCDNDVCQILKFVDESKLNEEFLLELIEKYKNKPAVIEAILLRIQFWKELTSEFIKKHISILPSSFLLLSNVKENFSDEELVKMFLRNNQENSIEGLIGLIGSLKSLKLVKDLLESEFNGIQISSSKNINNFLIINILDKLPESFYFQLFYILKKYWKECLTYRVLSYVLKNKLPDEAFLVDNVELFIENSLYKNLVDIARENKYSGLALAIRLNLD